MWNDGPILVTAGSFVRAAKLFVLLSIAVLFTGCASRSVSVWQEEQIVVAASHSGEPVVAMAPAFVLRGTQSSHNRIGRVEAMKKHGREAISINTGQPAIYAGIRTFATQNGAYINLVYRVHFPEVPFSLIPFHLSAGKNVGLIVILTLDVQFRPLLVTTANTCGCYAATIPTEHLPLAFYPDSWPGAPFSVYGEQLPGRLPMLQGNDVLQVIVREDVHRVMDVRIAPKDAPQSEVVQRAEVFGLDTLRSLPLEDGTSTSFYYERWPLAGHVKGAIKPWESILLSLVSLDVFVGMDKEYGGIGWNCNPFYTSLMPWNRKSSDLNDFPAYLRFNGWKL